MTAALTQLTPELAAQLLAKPHPRQRRISPNVVRSYARIMQQGRWDARAAEYDPIVVDKATQSLVNGAHRCAAVLQSKVTIPAYIDWEGDASVFDYIDTGRKRTASQFIRGANQSLRAAATRVVLWHELMFDSHMGAVNTYWQLAEIIDEAERLESYFDRLAIPASNVYGRTGLARGVILGAMTIASMRGYEDQVLDFAERLRNPQGLVSGEPALVLLDRMTRNVHRNRQRQPLEDWMILVRCLNAHILGDALPRRVLATTLWPRIGEHEAEFQRRANSAASVTSDRRLGAKKKASDG